MFLEAKEWPLGRGRTATCGEECSVCVSVRMAAQEMMQTSSQGCKKMPRAFPQTHNKTQNSALSVFLPRHVEVKYMV